MIRNIIFDIGNVLTDWRWKDFLHDKGFDDDMIARIGRATVETPTWLEFDHGMLTTEELMAQFVQNDPGLEHEFHVAFDDVHGMVVPRDYAIPWIRELKGKGYRVYYLSNFSKIAEEQCADSLSFIPYTDGGILSYKVQLVKPDPEIYRTLLRQYGLKADESVFIDDLPVNVDAAVGQGMHGIVFESREQATAELKKLGVE